MKSIKRATIVIPTYNRANYLDMTLRSVKNQDDATFETIVVDDGSNDNTFEIVSKYADELNLRYFFQEDRGNRTCLARNLGISYAESEIIVFIDCGMILKSDCISRHIRLHDESMEQAAVIGYAYGFDQYCPNIEELISFIDMEDFDDTIRRLEREGLFKDMRQKIYDRENFQINEMPAPWAFFITCNCSVKKSVLDKVGYFDQNLDFNWGVEDLELGFRLWKSRVKFIVGNAVAIHYPHEADMQEKFESEKVNKNYFHLKHDCIETKLFLDCGFLDLNDRILVYSNSVLI